MRSARLERLRSDDGYTLVEIMVVAGLVATLGAMSVFGVQSMLPTVWSDAALDQVVSAMRVGRESAINQRRPVEVRFFAPNQIQLVRIEPAAEVVLAQVVLESNPSFMTTPGLPDTPDAFGAGAAWDFGGANNIRFLADGTFTDDAGIPVNGSVFIGTPGNPMAARAITVTGVTGRAAAYRWNGRVWEEK
ncbi:MAG: Tfp pilus assembly protein FimT/FimU [Vicinamibacterales bacterium]